MSFIFIVVLWTRKRLTPKDVAEMKGLTFLWSPLCFLRYDEQAAFWDVTDTTLHRSIRTVPQTAN
jgi:hypothetical protein